MGYLGYYNFIINPYNQSAFDNNCYHITRGNRQSNHENKGEDMISKIAGMAIVLSITALYSYPTLTPGTWVNISPPGFGNGNLTQGMTVDQEHTDNIYLCVCANGCNSGGIAKGVWKSTNHGETWSLFHAEDSPNHVRVDPNNSNHVYTGDGVCGGTQGFYVTSDGGATWSRKTFDEIAAQYGFNCSGLGDVYNISVDPANFSHVLVSGHSPWSWCDGNFSNAGVLESTDGGSSWIPHRGQSGFGYGNAVAFLYNPTAGIGNTSTWIFGSQGSGYWRTTNKGETWTNVDAHTQTHGGTQIYAAPNGHFFMSCNNGILRSTNAGVSWQLGSNLPYGSYLAVTSDGTNLYTGMSGGDYIYTTPISDGLRWTSMGGYKFINAGPFEMDYDPKNGIVYAACQSNGMWAYKVPGSSTQTVNTGKMARPSCNESTDKWMIPISMNSTKLSGNFSDKSRAADIYDVKGKLIGHATVAPDGVVKIDRNRIGRQAVIISMQ
jgi:photosystem II stability/assembly factor-like uncharacterized protein